MTMPLSIYRAKTINLKVAEGEKNGGIETHPIFSNFVQLNSQLYKRAHGVKMTSY